MITIKVKKYSSTFIKLKGLMFTDSINPIFFQTRFGIHTFFVKHPIDVVILDNNFVVKNLTRSLKPFRIFMWNPLYKYVLELPEGNIYKENIKLGSKIKITFK